MDFKWHTCYNLVPNICPNVIFISSNLTKGGKKKIKEWNYLLIYWPKYKLLTHCGCIMWLNCGACLPWVSCQGSWLFFLSFFFFLLLFFLSFSTLRCLGLTLHQGRVVLPHFPLNYRSWNLVGYSASDYLHCHWAVVWKVLHIVGFME